jgi:hypothetical protein
MHNRVSFLHQIDNLLIADVDLVVLQPVFSARLLDVPFCLSIRAEYLGAHVIIDTRYIPTFARKQLAAFSSD